MPTLKKGSKEAKDYMAYIRSLKKTIKPKKTTKPKKVGAIKIVEKGENKFTKPSAIFEYTRTKKGTFKGMKKIGATKPSTHKDTKSHNVNIRVLSGSKKMIGNVNRYHSIIFTKYSKKFGKRVLLKNSFQTIVLDIESKEPYKGSTPIVEKGTMVYMLKPEKFSYDNGDTTGTSIYFSIPSNDFENAKNIAKMIAKSILYK